MDHLVPKFIVAEIMYPTGIIRREFINSAHIQRLYVENGNVYMELQNNNILKSTSTNLDSFIEKIYP